MDYFLRSAVGGLSGRSLNFYRREGIFSFFTPMHTQVGWENGKLICSQILSFLNLKLQMCLPLWVGKSGLSKRNRNYKYAEMAYPIIIRNIAYWNIKKWLKRVMK